MIDILIPSRSRYSRLIKVIASALDKAKDKDSFHFYVRIDEDEDQIEDYKKLGDTSLVTLLIGKNKVLSELWNECYKAGCGEILMHGSDDINFESSNWDVIVHDYFKKNSIGLIYGDDGHTKDLATHSFTSRYAADLVGYFVPPYFEADFNDVWLTEVYSKLGKLKYEKGIVTRHYHPNADHDTYDDTYLIAEDRRVRAAIVWNEKKHLIDEDVKKLSV